MKKLSDYKGHEAFELWADLFVPISKVLGDKTIAGLIRKKTAVPEMAKAIVDAYEEQATEILLRIDPTPINGFNLMVRLCVLLKEIGGDPDMQAFFGLQPEEKKAETSSGSATENTEEEEN